MTSPLTVGLEDTALIRLIRKRNLKLEMSADVSRERDEATECRPGAPQGRAEQDVRAAEGHDSRLRWRTTAGKPISRGRPGNSS